MGEKKQVKLNLTVLVVGALVLVTLGIAIGQLLAKTKENVENSIMTENYNTVTDVEYEDPKVEEKEKSSTEKESNVENTVKELDADNKNVQELYSYIEKFNYYEEELVYKTNKVELKDVSNQLKLLTVFSNLTEEDATESYMEYSEVYPDGNKHLIYTQKIVENKAKQIFGADVKITHENASPYDSYTREYKNGAYDCYSYEGGGDVPWSMSYSAILRAEESNDKIYIYDRYVHLVEVEDIKEDGINYGGSFDIFTATDRKEKIATKLNLENKGYYKNVPSGLSNNQKNNILLDKINSYIDGEVLTYKHTFEKDKDGYYWVSTEPVK